MYKFYVYLILDEKRLVILKNPVDDKNYHLLMDNNGANENLLLNTCKMFCLGYYFGSLYDEEVVNNPQEFL